MPSRHFTALNIFVAVILMASASRAAVPENKRMALVIGNAAYPTAPLANPVNDAIDIAALLERLGFEVILERDADKRAMDQAVKKFYRSLQSSKGIALFYYAGHGLQMHGQNYLVPVNAEIESEGDVEYNAVNAGWVLSKMEDAGSPVNIVILDACRNNPFTRGFRSGERGLAQMPSPTGSIIAYATAPGEVASDGEGRNGLFTQHLLQHMAAAGLTIEQVFSRVRQGVWLESGKKQTPWTSSSVMGQVSLNNGTTTITTAPSQEGTEDALQVERERLDREKRELEALKAKVEADKQRVDEDRRLAEERAGIEAERLRIEREKQSLLAMVKPPPSVTAPGKKERTDKSIRLAIFPFYFDLDENRVLALFRSNVLSGVIYQAWGAILKGIERYPSFKIEYSFYDPLPAQTDNIKPVKFNIDENLVWLRKSLFSSKELNYESVYEKTSSIDADLAIVGKIEGNIFEIIVLDPVLKRSYKETAMLVYENSNNLLFSPGEIEIKIGKTMQKIFESIRMKDSNYPSQ